MTTAQPFFGRLITAMITPMTLDRQIDFAQAERLADMLVQQGSDALVLCGTTGESPTLTWDEEHRLFEVVRHAVGSRAKILAGTGSNATAEAIAATQKAASFGLDGTLQVTPYYNKPPQEGLYQHFRAIAYAAPSLPMMLYNIPSRTGCRMEVETICRLSDIESIVAVKDATGDLDHGSQLRSLLPESFAIYAGDDALTLPLMAIGACGVVSVASHLVGSRLKEMIEKFHRGNIAAARSIHLELYPLFKSLFTMTNPIPIKTALRLLGHDTGVVRSPLTEGTPQLESQLRQELHRLNLLVS
ncbi:MAG: 4-hydroxy-tetrahydrodipicolinate synthase [Oscillatoriales cyanobacterium SM2_2_1]|nr:4-hydroxy-tetrahydrodipicolinate synthase [Oscillatoriales cyanobacterium SM2_2_1]